VGAELLVFAGSPFRSAVRTLADAREPSPHSFSAAWRTPGETLESIRHVLHAFRRVVIESAGALSPCPNHPARMLRHRYLTDRVHPSWNFRRKLCCWLGRGHWRRSGEVRRLRYQPIIVRGGVDGPTGRAFAGSRRSSAECQPRPVHGRSRTGRGSARSGRGARATAPLVALTAPRPPE